MTTLSWGSTIAITAIACSLAAQDRRITPVGASARRVALVIGNNTYATSPLANAIRDAQAMKIALEAAGFSVQMELNTSQQRLEEAVEQFVGVIRPGDVALFYYSGHGMQIQEQNYLVPVDFQAATAVAAKYRSYPVSRVVESIEAAGAVLQMVILDACRDNPYRSIRSGTGGLAPMQVGTGTYLAFATAPGKTASDNPAGQNGLFTQELAAVLRQPGLSLDEVFNQVRARVSQGSRNQQIPWSTSSVVGNFYFIGAPAAAASAARLPASPADEIAWAFVKDSNRTDLLQQFVREYPDSPYAGAARLKISALQPVTSAAASAAPTSASVRPAGVSSSVVGSARTASPSSQGPDFSGVRITTNKIAANFYTLEGAGGTIGVLAGRDETLMVDSEFAPLGSKIAAAIQQISSAPIKYLINTHVHGDHTGGNEYFAKQGATIIGRPELRERLMHPNPPGQPAPYDALPSRTYEGTLTLNLGGELVNLFAIPNAHTDGDTAVYFVNEDVLMVGDVYRSVQFPFIDRANGGSLQGLEDGLEEVIQICRPSTKVVPGHGTIVDRNALRENLDIIRSVHRKVADLVAQGKSQEEVVAAKPAAEFRAKINQVGSSEDRFVTQVYEDLKAR